MSRVKLQEELKGMGICVIRKGDIVGGLTVEPELYAKVREKQKGDPKLEKSHAAVEEGMPSRFVVGIDGCLIFDGRWCVPDDKDLKRKIFIEAHSTPYFVHPGGDKLYKNLKKTFWWPRMKKEVAEFVSRCFQKLQEYMGTTLKMSTAFHPATNEHTKMTIQTLEDMFRACVLEFEGSREERLDLIEFSYNNSYYASICMALFEALYRRKCRSPVCWDNINDAVTLGP
ncbi:uncharacterized protein LOC141640604 [Silene latifolia]|uniref:uncharacterized protein LOC141640604 n=1 Tax=Silene latifolia TaxID=37657 RepID=UPI003D7833F4